jgi:hypothetical protein
MWIKTAALGRPGRFAAHERRRQRDGLAHHPRAPAVVKAAAAALLGFALPALAAGAQTPAPKDVVVPIQARHGSGVAGTVTLHPDGHRTMINVNMFSGPAHLRPKLVLLNGRDCTEARLASTKPIPLNPVNTGQVSRTFVEMPIESFGKSNYVVAVRDATTRQQALEGCAQLGR